MSSYDSRAYMQGFEIIEDDNDLREGDHLAVEMVTQAGLKIVHHGIVVNGEFTRKIISASSQHKKGGSSDKILKQEVRQFSGASKKLRVKYKTGLSFSGREIAERAEQLLNHAAEFGGYNARNNNCEHFATLCTTGKKVSEQTDTWSGYMKILRDSYNARGAEVGDSWGQAPIRAGRIRSAGGPGGSVADLPRFVGG